MLTDLLDEIQNVLEEGLHTYCEEDPLGLKRHDISRSSLGYVRQTETISSSGWSFGIDDTSFDRLLAPKEQELVSLP